MILKFDEFVRINEGSNESVISLSYLKKTLEPFGWKFSHSTGGDNIKATKGKYVNSGHLLHGNRSDDNRKIDIAYLNRLRKMFIDEFFETGDLSTIKSIPWDEWRLMNPLDRELKDYDVETGKKKENEVDLNTGQKLNQAKIKKQINTSNELYKDAQLWKIDDSDENSLYIMMNINDKGKPEYNTCRSFDDRRPILKEWVSQMNFKKEGKYYYFGKDDMKIFHTKFYKVLPDGKLDKKETISLRESKNIEKKS